MSDGAVPRNHSLYIRWELCGGQLRARLGRGCHIIEIVIVPCGSRFATSAELRQSAIGDWKLLDRRECFRDTLDGAMLAARAFASGLVKLDNGEEVAL